MKTSNKYKFLLGFGYILILSVFLYFIFSNFSFQEIGNYNFIKDNREFFVKLKEKNVLILATIFIFFTIIWVLLLGFGSPISIVGGFIFGTWLGTILVTISLTIGATCLYLFAMCIVHCIYLYIKCKSLNSLLAANASNKSFAVSQSEAISE